MFYTTVTFDENYLFLFLKEGTAYGTQIFYSEINDLRLEGAEDFIALIDNPIAEFSYVQNDGTKFFFETDYEAPFMKIIAIDLEKPELEHWSDVIAEPANSAYSYGSTVIDKTKILRLVSN
jgi:prolyl oligopeptidase